MIMMFCAALKSSRAADDVGRVFRESNLHLAGVADDEERASELVPRPALDIPPETTFSTLERRIDRVRGKSWGALPSVE